MARFAWVVAGCLTAVAMPLAAQSSQFGVRGLGYPGRGLSARALGSGGSAGMFEGESSRNPASLSMLRATTTTFNTTSTWRKSFNAGGGGSTTDARFPEMSVGGPVAGTRLSLGFSNSMFTNRDFGVVSGGVEIPRDEPVEYADSLSSRGGINNMRLAAGWQLTPRLALGAGLDILTGEDRLTTRRVWADTMYRPTQQSGELSYKGLGVTVGALLHPTARWEISAALQTLGALSVQRDSGATVNVAMPMTLTGAIRGTIGKAFRVSGLVAMRSWSRSNDDLVAGNGFGSRNTVEVNGGVEFLRNRNNPDQLPLRVGIRRADLPFPLRVDGKASESSFSVGSGFRFARNAAGIDFALERAKRAQGDSYHETAWMLTFGVSLRASGGVR